MYLKLTQFTAVDAVASIIGTVSKEDTANIEVKEEEKQTEVTPDPVQEESKKEEEVQPQPEPTDDKKMEIETEGLNSTEESIKQNDNEDDLIQLEDLKGELDPVSEFLNTFDLINVFFHKIHMKMFVSKQPGNTVVEVSDSKKPVHNFYYVFIQNCFCVHRNL